MRAGQDTSDCPGITYNCCIFLCDYRADNMAHDFDRMGVIVSNDGKVHWEPGGIFTTTCDIDITYFPFDSQECSVIVGAWAYYTQRMNLTNATSVVSTARNIWLVHD